MAANVFLTFFDNVDGESTAKGWEKWIEVQSWAWGLETPSSWTMGSGASVGKPNPGKFIWEHAFDASSPTLLGYASSGRIIPKAELRMTRARGRGQLESYFTMTMEGVMVTAVSTTGMEDGSARQRVEMVFRAVQIDYRPKDRLGRPSAPKTYSWDIPAGVVSPAA